MYKIVVHKGIAKKLRAIAKALIDRFGYAGAARFIAIKGGRERDSVRDIRARQSDIDEITERIKRRSIETSERKG